MNEIVRSTNVNNILTGRSAHGKYLVVETLNNSCILEFISKGGSYILTDSNGELVFKSVAKAKRTATKHNERISK